METTKDGFAAPRDPETPADYFVEGCSADQRSLGHAFHRARRQEEKAERDWDEDE